MDDIRAQAIQVACNIARVFEGFRSSPYLCPAGVWTIGYGTTRYPDGRKVGKDDEPITRDYAEELLVWEMGRCADGAVRYCPVLVDFPSAWGAIADFCYNLGIGRLQYSTLRRKINVRDWDGAKEELMKWVYGGGRKLPGLVRRRMAEAALL